MAKTKISKDKNGSKSCSECGKIQARILDFDHGLRVVNRVRLIRLKSNDYSLLIMEDYFPAMGSISGTVELVTDTDQLSLGAVKGFFLHHDNEFSLLIEDQLKRGDSGKDGDASI